MYIQQDDRRGTLYYPIPCGQPQTKFVHQEVLDNIIDKLNEVFG